MAGMFEGMGAWCDHNFRNQPQSSQHQPQLSQKTTIVTTPTTIVAILINHNCRNTNHKCCNFFEKKYCVFIIDFVQKFSAILASLFTTTCKLWQIMKYVAHHKTILQLLQFYIEIVIIMKYLKSLLLLCHIEK